MLDGAARRDLLTHPVGSRSLCDHQNRCAEPFCAALVTGERERSGLLQGPCRAVRAHLRGRRCRVRHLSRLLAALASGRQRAHARDRSRRAGGRRCIPAQAVHHGRDRRDRAFPPARLLRQARLGDGDRLPDRRDALGRGRLHRDERRRALERAHRRSGQGGAQARAGRRVSRRLGHRPARRRPRALRRRRLLLGSHRLAQPHSDFRDRRSHRPRVRRLADLGVRASRRRHLHQGCRRRRRPGREDRGGDPRGRPAQPGRDRRQRRRQRRRLRRHGGRPVRDVRGHRGRGHAARHCVPDRRAVALPAVARRDLDPRVGDRHVLRARRPGPERDHQRPLQGRDRGDGPLGDRVHPGHARLRRRQVQLLAAVRVGADRPGRHVLAGRDHRVLHGHALGPGQVDLGGVPDRARDEHHRRSRRWACRRRLRP